MKRQAKLISSEKMKSLEYLNKESVELSLIYCGYEECDAGYRFSQRKRDCYMLYVVRGGKGTCEINGKLYDLKKNDAVLIFPDTECWFGNSSEESWSYMWIGFTGMKAEVCVMHAGFSFKAPVHNIECTEKMYELINYMMEVRDKTFGNELKRNGLLKVFFSELIEDYNKQAKIQLKHSYGGETSAHIKNAITYIAENYMYNIKINELADYIGVNRSYLASSFKRVTGYSPKEYLLSLRMEKAKSLLEKTDMPINLVANSVGYTDQLAFSRMFKRYSGISPKAYREEWKI